MPDGLRCTVVTPTASLFDEPATYVNIPAWDGQLGVMPGTSPFLTRLGIGVLTVQGEGGKKVFAVGGGFAQFQNGVLTLLADEAAAGPAIDASKAEAQLSAIDAKLAEGAGTSTRDRESLDRARRFAFTKLSLARR